MGDPAGLTAVLDDIVGRGDNQAPRRICEASVAMLGVDHAAISVRSAPDRREPMWAGDAVAADLDDLRFTLGEGPCVEAFTNRAPVLVADLDDGPHRWPVFADAARTRGVRAVFVLPLQVGAVAVGVLELSRDTPGMLSDGELAGALHAADAALWTLIGLHHGGQGVNGQGVNGQGANGQGACLDWPPGALHRTEVYQATGMVTEQLAASPGVALSVLRAYAFLHGRDIGDVARDVVERRIRMNEET